MDDYLAVNRANWDGRVPLHVASEFYDVEGFKAGASPLRTFELEELGDVEGKSLLHLQCHFGLDTLDWARRGAKVTGLDFSEKAVEAARQVAADCDIDARFVQADVYDAVKALGETYDIVYTGVGALVWLPDLTCWARTIADLLNPGGVFYIAEFHPMTDMLDDKTGTTITSDYFAKGPEEYDWPYTYTGDEPLKHTKSVQFTHDLGEVVTALAQAGLRIEFLHEHDFTLFQRFQPLVAADGVHRFPKGRPRVPLMYSLKAGSAPPPPAAPSSSSSIPSA